VRQARHLLDQAGSTAYIEVDGGVSPTNLGTLREAGANAFVSAHSIFKDPHGIADGIAGLRASAERVPPANVRRA
jgi:ribulose-phosphate 3-epimerase